ncbi:helix-hairpin-helix domain-containing protein, partial [Acidimicrobiales bacterium]|nr:helix-hairpin-helix domain-containing protein [Acidimicrobiales bacterium]
MASSRDVIAMLSELISLTTLDEESAQSFKVRAYDNARLAVESYTGNITELSEKEMVELKGLGKATAAKIRELVDNGKVTKLEELRAEYPPAFAEMARIPGVGPKTLKAMRRELNINTVEQLKAALDAQQIRTLPRMGAKSEEKIAKALDRIGMSGKDRRTPIADAMPLAERLVEAFLELPTVTDAVFCGSLRRMSETIGDIDITVASTDPVSVMEAVRERNEVVEIVVSGDTKTSFLTSTGLQVDVRAVLPEHFGAATLYFTGSKQHNIALRMRAIKKGWLLNEYGLLVKPDEDAEDQTPTEVVAAETEESIYQALGLAFIPAPMRESTGEIEAAEAGDFSDLVRLSDIQGDLHYHTAQSGDGRSSVADMVQVAADAGHAYLAITDHGEDLAINGSNAEEMLAHRELIYTIQDDHPDMKLLWGCELNIGAAGGLDYEDDFRAMFDYTVASVHSHYDQSTLKQTERLVAAIADPTVDSIGHLTGRKIGHRPGIELEMDIVLEALIHFDVALEINGSLNR